MPDHPAADATLAERLRAYAEPLRFAGNRLNVAKFNDLLAAADALDFTYRTPGPTLEQVIACFGDWQSANGVCCDTFAKSLTALYASPTLPPAPEPESTAAPCGEGGHVVSGTPHLGRAIKAARLRAGYGLREFAEHIGVSPLRYHVIECMDNPSADEMARIFDGLIIPWDEPSPAPQAASAAPPEPTPSVREETLPWPTDRTYIAVHALQGIIAHHLPNPENAAEEAVRYADALLAALEYAEGT